MSKEGAKEFLLKLRTDKELVSKVKDAYAEGICRVAGEAGFDFSKAELGKAVGELKENLSGELTDADLEAAAGGLFLGVATQDDINVTSPGPNPIG